jgi:hypothetical protein
MTTRHDAPLKARNRSDPLRVVKEKQNDNSRLEEIIVTGDEQSGSIEVVPSEEFISYNAKVSPTLSSKTALTASVTCEQRASWSLSSNSIQTLSYVDDDEDILAHAPPKMIQSYTSDSFSPVYELTAADGKNIFQECRRDLPAPGNTPRFGTLSYKTSLDFPDDENSITEFKEENTIQKMPEAPTNNKGEQTVEMKTDQGIEEEENLDAKPTPKITNQTYRSNVFKMKVKRFARSHLSKQIVKESNNGDEIKNGISIQCEKSKVQHASIEQDHAVTIVGDGANSKSNMNSLQEGNEKTSYDEQRLRCFPQQSSLETEIHNKEEKVPADSHLGDVYSVEKRFRTKRFARTHLAKIALSKGKEFSHEDKKPATIEGVNSVEKPEALKENASGRAASKGQNLDEQMSGNTVFLDKDREISRPKSNENDSELPKEDLNTNRRESEATIDTEYFEEVNQMKQLEKVVNEVSSVDDTLTSPENTKTEQPKDAAWPKENNRVLESHRLETTEAKEVRITPTSEKEIDVVLSSRIAETKHCQGDFFSKERICKTSEEGENLDKTISSASGHPQCESGNNSTGTSWHDLMQKSLLSNMCQVALSPEKIQKTCFHSIDGSLLIQVATDTDASTQSNKNVCVPSSQLVAFVPVQSAFLKCLLPGGDTLLTNGNHTAHNVLAGGSVETTKTYVEQNVGKSTSACVQGVNDNTTNASAELHIQKDVSQLIPSDNVSATKHCHEGVVQKDYFSAVRQRQEEAKNTKFRYNGELGSLFDPALREMTTYEENEEDTAKKSLQSKLTKEILEILEGGKTKRKQRVDDEKSETCASESTNALLQDKELLAVMKLTKDGEDASLLFPTFSYDSMYDVCESDDGLSGEVDALSDLEGHIRAEMEDAVKLDQKLLRRLPVISPMHTLSSETTTSCSEAAGYLTDTTSGTQETASTRGAKSFRKVTFNDNVQEHLFFTEMCEPSPSAGQQPRVPPGVYEATVDEIISIVDDFLDEIGSVCTSAIGFLPKPSFPFPGSTHCS